MTKRMMVFWLVFGCICCTAGRSYSCDDFPIACMDPNNGEGSPLVVSVGDSVYFSDNGSRDPDGGYLINYSWCAYNPDDPDDWEELDWGSPFTAIQFNEPGLCEIRYFVKDDEGWWSDGWIEPSGPSMNPGGYDSCWVEVVEPDVEMQVSVSGNVCDGEEVDIDLVLTSEGLADRVTGCYLVATKPGGGTEFDNPASGGLTISLRDPNDPDIREWKVENARWYSTQEDHCNTTATYEITAYVQIDGDDWLSSDAGSLTVSADANCVDGQSRACYPYWSGNVTYDTVEVGDHWECTVSQGTLARDVHADVDVYCSAQSQYYDMVNHEELFHAAQITLAPCSFDSCGGTSTIFSDLWDPTRVMTEVDANEPYVGPHRTAALLAASTAVANAKSKEETRSVDVFLSRLCAMEIEAKSHTGASYRGSLECAHPECAE